MPNPKLATLIDAFTAGAINTTLWDSITGTATLDTVNDLVALAQPTTSGTNNTFASTALRDATGSSIYAEIGCVPNGNGQTKTIFKLLLDASNSVAIRLEAGVFKFTMQIAGTTTTTTLAAYDPNAHGWWRLREASGSFYADASADGYTWVNLTSSTYSWSATGLQFIFQTGAGATEAAGNVATIQHINTMTGGPFNINWPVVEDAWGAAWSANNGFFPLDKFVDVTGRTKGSVSASRGRQYELDQVRSGEASMTLSNTDGNLDPINASGPWYGHIGPYQPYRRRAQWPPTRNLLTQAQATGGDLGGLPLGAITPALAVYSSTDSGGGTLAAASGAWAGGTVLQFSVPSTSTAPTMVAYTPQTAVKPGAAYTVSLQARNITASTSVQVHAAIMWLDANVGIISTTTGSNSTLTGSATAAWTGVSATGTAPANAAMMYVGLRLNAAPASTCTVQIDGWQCEKAAAPSSWACPGVWYPVYAGYMERWPSSWDMHGTYGTVQPTAVDALSLLSQQTLSDPLTQEINLRSPRFLYRLDDPAGSTSAADATGAYPAAPLAKSKYGAGTWAFGATVASTGASGTFTGASGTVAAVDNPNPGANTASAGTFLNLAAAGIRGPGSTAWTRMIAFRNRGPNPPTSAATLWSAADAGKNPAGGSLFLLNFQSSGVLVECAGPTSGAAGLVGGSGAVLDGNWHLALFGYDGVDNMMISVDGVTSAFGGWGATYNPTGCVSDAVAEYSNGFVANDSTDNFKGDVAFACEFSRYLSAADCTALYNGWKSAFTGESTSARYARILSYATYQGASSIQAGLTTSMGPAILDGQDAVSALQAVVDTENGAHFVARDGTLTFKSRSARYNATTPAYVFGERTDLGEWPYEDCQLDFDSTHLSNQVTVTQEGTQQTFYAQDATSIARYFPRTLTRTINASDPLECQDAANYLLSRYKSPATRVSAIRLHPSAMPQLWPVCLSLELGTRARVMRRPPAAPAVQVECFVEQIQWEAGDGGEAFVTLQCSPADTALYGIFAAWHTTLHTTIASGVASITVDASADTTNPLNAQLAAGQQLILGQGTANAETVTVQSAGATSPGWTTAVLTLAANTTKSHTAGDTVCEPLPAGITGPTAFDATSTFDAVAFAY